IRPRLKRSTAQNIRILSHEQYQTRRDKIAGTFDAVMIDAPCSGTGVLRRNPGARFSIDAESVERLTKLQSEILDEYSGAVKRGGLLLYATCSLLRAEGEYQILSFFDRHATEWEAAEINVPVTMRTSDGFMRCYPHRHKTDGFFAAILRRKRDYLGSSESRNF